eukprot:g4843.t1
MQTQGAQPYADVDDIPAFVLGGGRLDLPSLAPGCLQSVHAVPEFNDIMASVFSLSQRPAASPRVSQPRPRVSQITQTLQKARALRFLDWDLDELQAWLERFGIPRESDLYEAYELTCPSDLYENLKSDKLGADALVVMLVVLMILVPILITRQALHYLKEFSIVTLTMSKTKFKVDLPASSRFDATQVTTGPELGSGAFGTVFRGDVQTDVGEGSVTTPVAIKTVKSELITEEQQRDVMIDLDSEDTGGSGVPVAKVTDFGLSRCTGRRTKDGAAVADTYYATVDATSGLLRTAIPFPWTAPECLKTTETKRQLQSHASSSLEGSATNASQGKSKTGTDTRPSIAADMAAFDLELLQREMLGLQALEQWTLSNY